MLAEEDSGEDERFSRMHKIFCGKIADFSQTHNIVRLGF